MGLTIRKPGAKVPIELFVDGEATGAYAVLLYPNIERRKQCEAAIELPPELEDADDDDPLVEAFNVERSRKIVGLMLDGFIDLYVDDDQTELFVPEFTPEGYLTEDTFGALIGMSAMLLSRCMGLLGCDSITDEKNSLRPSASTSESSETTEDTDVQLATATETPSES